MGPSLCFNPLDPEHRKELEDYLSRLFQSESFSGSARRERLLRYLIGRTLAGESATVNEYAVGIDVFHKLPSFDPRNDSVVRTDIARLRQRLRSYYEGAGAGDRFVLRLQPRSYAVQIDFRGQNSVPAPPTRRPILMIAAAALVLVAAGIGAWRWQVSGRRQISMVVLPFRNFSPDPDAAYLADGITEELTNQFAQWKDVRVVSRTSAFVFKDRDVDIREIGRRLGADEAIEGSFEKQGSRVRITAQMVRTSDGTHLWSHAYDESSSDMLTVQEDIARAITQAVRTLGSAVPDTRSFEVSADREANDLYLRGCSELMRQTADSIRNAEALFRAAISKDPQYGAAYYRLAQTEYQHLQSAGGLTPAALSDVHAQVQRALELEPRFGEARAFLASGVWAFNWNWPLADREFHRALEEGAGPVTHSLYAVALATRGRFAEAHQQLNISAQSDPLSSGWKWNQGFVYMLERNWAKAEEMTRLVIDVAPEQAHVRLLTIYVAQRDCARADTEARWLRENARSASAVKLRALAMDEGCRGDSRRAVQELTQADDAPGLPDYFYDACIYGSLHRGEDALDRLRRSADAHELAVVQMKYQWSLDGLRKDPRFIALEQRVGLQP